MIIDEAFDKALELEAAGQTGEAIMLYKTITVLDPDKPEPYVNLGILFKHMGSWQDCFDANKKAVELAPNEEGAWWNLGIAATALRKWSTAREAWNIFGLELPINDEEPRIDLPLNPIRLNPKGKPEVLWAKRIDPARAIIENIPLPDSGFRYKDLILNDGQPIGQKLQGGRLYPVLNALQLIESSSFKTYWLKSNVNSAVDIELLDYLSEKEGIGFEDWSDVSFICNSCAVGISPERTRRPVERGISSERIFGFAAQSDEQIKKVLQSWAGQVDCEYGELILELD